MTYERIALFLILVVGVSVRAGFAAAADPLGFYVGGAAGQAAIKIDQLGTGVALGFDKHHIGWKALFGVRPISMLGAEFEYVNFGHPSTVIGNNVNADAEVRGPAVFALAYLPLPLLDVYGKVGLARLQTTATAWPAQAGSASRPRADVVRGAIEAYRLEAREPAGVRLGAVAIRYEPNSRGGQLV